MSGRPDDGGRAERPEGVRRPARDNGLHAPAYVPLTDVDPTVGQHLLTALGRARIAAYLDPSPVHTAHQQRLFVASDERADAGTIVAAAVRALGESQPDLPRIDPLDGLDTDSAFEALVADWKVDTIAAVREAERELSREDADWRARLAQPQASDEVWLEDEHYVPPPPPPLPRLAGPTILAMSVLAISIVILGMGGYFGLASNLTLLLGVGGLLMGAAILFTRLREARRDEDDDGSAI